MSFVRRFMAGIAQFVAIVLIIFFTAYSGFHAWSWAKTVRFISDQLLRGAAELRRTGMGTEFLTPQNLEMLVQVSNFSDPTVWAIVGAILGFLMASAVGGVIFMLAEIAHNSRRTVAFFDRAAARRDE